MESTGDENKKNAESLKDKLKLFFKNKIVSWMVALNLFFNIANWVALWVFIKPVDSSIILHYNVYFGVDMTGNWKMAFVMPSIGLALFLINGLLAFYFYLKLERIASHILLMASLMIQISLLIASTGVIIINY